MGTIQNIPQTHRTILFEEFDNSDQQKRLNILLDPRISENEDIKNLNIDEQLGVKSFEEFLKKFAPKVYEYFISDDENHILAAYTTDKGIADQNGGVPIPITGHAYYQMLAAAYVQKGSSGDSNIKFDASKIKEILTPQSEIRAAYNLRGTLKVLFQQYEKARKNNEPTKFFRTNINNTLREIKDNYKASKIKMLPIAHDDLVKKIQTLDDKIKFIDKTGSEGKSSKVQSGELSFDETGKVILIPLQSQSTEALANKDNPKLLAPGQENDDSIKQKLIGVVSESYDQNAPNGDSFTKSLVLSVYTEKAIATPISDLNKEQLIAMRDRLIERRDQYESILAQAKEAFIKALTDVIQKLLGVKIFFDHATVKGGDKGELSPALLVANCKVSDLINDETIRGSFEKFIEHRGLTETDENKIWFAILPHVLDSSVQNVDDDQDDDFKESSFFDDDDDDEEIPKIDGVDFSSAKTLLKILNQNKIMTIFNFVTTDQNHNTFAGIKAQCIEKMKEQLNTVPYEHAVFAYPNFTLMPECKIPISDSEDAPKISVPAVYIDAAYVAAGLLIASQQPLYLKKHGFNDRVDDQNACVHVDLEEDDLVNNITTHFNRENTYSWNKDITETINSDQFGFAFCGNRKFNPSNNTYLKNTYILCARTLEKRGKYYQPIYKVLTKDFIITYIKAVFSNSKIYKSDLESRLEDHLKIWRKDAARKVDNINLILRNDEDVKYEAGELRIIFNDDEEIISASDLNIIEDNKNNL